MFEHFLYQDVTEKWTWIDGDADQARSKLSQWLKKRDEVVHSSNNDTQTIHLVSRADMKKCITSLKN